VRSLSGVAFCGNASQRNVNTEHGIDKFATDIAPVYTRLLLQLITRNPDLTSRRHEEENGRAKTQDQKLPDVPMLLEMALPVPDTAEEEAASALQHLEEAR